MIDIVYTRRYARSGRTDVNSNTDSHTSGASVQIAGTSVIARLGGEVGDLTNFVSDSCRKGPLG